MLIVFCLVLAIITVVVCASEHASVPINSNVTVEAWNEGDWRQKQADMLHMLDSEAFCSLEDEESGECEEDY